MQKNVLKYVKEVIEMCLFRFGKKGKKGQKEHLRLGLLRIEDPEAIELFKRKKEAEENLMKFLH